MALITAPMAPARLSASVSVSVPAGKTSRLTAYPVPDPLGTSVPGVLGPKQLEIRNARRSAERRGRSLMLPAWATSAVRTRSRHGYPRPWFLVVTRGGRLLRIYSRGLEGAGRSGR